MRVIEISNKVFLIRHWFVWYRVERGATRWSKLNPILKKTIPLPAASIEQSLESLKKAGKVSISKPSIDI